MEAKVEDVWFLTFRIPFQIKLIKEIDSTKSKEFINDWFGIKYKCDLCTFLTSLQECQFYIINTS